MPIDDKIERLARADPKLWKFYERYNATRRSGVLYYRCRRCRKTFEKGHVPDVLLAFAFLVIRGETPDEWADSHKKESIHFCEGKRFGVADFIGADFDFIEIDS